jgi:hypothetical protein
MSCQKEQTFTLEIKDGTRIVHNLKPQIENPESRVEFVVQIGELEPEDEHYLFDQPLSAAEDHEGNIYRLDTEAGCIKKFTPSGMYLMEFGRMGQGPGEFEYPMQIDCRSGQLLVASMGSQFLIFDLEGEYIKKFGLQQYEGFGLKFLDSDRVVGYSLGFRHDNTKGIKIMKIYDTEGNVMHEFGDPLLMDNSRSSWSVNVNAIAVDDDSNIFVAFGRQNRIEKYSDSGELLLKISRELPFGIEYKRGKRKIEIRGEVREVDRDIFTFVSRGIGVDSQGRIWVLGYKDQIPQDPVPEDLNITEFLYFEVFSEEGILLARLPFPGGMERFDNMTMSGDHIYFADPLGEGCVYKYRAVWRD